MMNKLTRFLILNHSIFCLFFIHSCKTVVNVNEEEKTTETVNFSETKRTINLKLRSDSTLKVKNSVATITLYGYDQLMADVGASIICQKKIDITQLPVYFDLELPVNPESLIKPKISARENAKYYLSFYCDNNNNGIHDKGDIKLNFDKGSSNVNLDSKETQVFFVKEF